MNFLKKSQMKLRKQFYENQIVDYDRQANLCKQEMKYFEALELHKKCYEMACDLYGRYAIETLICLNNLGRTYADTGDYFHALDAALEVYNHIQGVLSRRSYEFIVICYNLGLSYYDIFDYQKALEMYKQCYDLSQTYYGLKNRDTLLYLYSLGIVYYDIGDYQKAYDMIQEAYHMQKSIFGETDIDTLKSMKELGIIGNQLGYHQEAVKILEICYDMLKKYYGKDNDETIAVYSCLGKLYLNLKEYAKAQEVLSNVYQIRKERLGQTHVRTLITLSDLSTVYYQIGEYQKSLELAKKAYITMKETYGEKYNHCLDMLQNYIRCLQKNNDIEKAIEFQDKLYLLKKEKYGYNDPKTLQSLHDLSYLYYAMGKNLKAIELEEKCYALQKEVLGETHRDTLNSLNQLIDIYVDLDQYEQALSYCLKVYEIEEKLFGEKDKTFINTLSQLALIYFRLSYYKEAFKKYERCYHLQKEVFGENSIEVLESLINMYVIHGLMNQFITTHKPNHQSSMLYAQIEEHLKNINSSQFTQVSQMMLLFISSMLQNHKQSPQTIGLLEQYYQQLKQVKGSLHPETIYALHIMAQAYESLDLIKSNQLYRDAYELYHKVLGPKHMTTLLCLGGLVLSYHKLHIDNLFEMYAKRFLEDMKQQIYQYYLLSEASHKNFLLSLVGVIQIYQSYYFHHHRNLTDYQYLVSYKNIIQDIEVLRSRLKQIPQYIQKINHMNHIEKQIHQTVDIHTILHLQQQKEKIHEELKQMMKQYQDQLMLNMNDSMIVSHLQDNDLLLDYYQLNQHQYGLVVIGKDLFESYVVDDYGVDKIQKYLEHIQHIYICPDGDLYHVSFERFIDKDISYLSSPKGLFYEGNIHNHDDIVSFVSPDFDDTLTDDGFDETRGEGKKSSLPGSLVEGHYIRSIFPQAKIYSGKKANVTEFLDVHSPSILHVSTHGEYLQGEQNIMERGRLCLAGYNQTNHKEEYQKGYVSANDIQKEMDLKNTNLLVLSACLTAKGDVLPGEGIYGLRRAFELAGVKTMILTVEAIHDHNAAIFMKTFYRKYHENKNVYQSFLETKKYLRDDRQALKELQIYADEFSKYVSKVYPKSYRFMKRRLENYLHLCQNQGYLLRNENEKEDWNGFIIQGKIR